MARRSDHFYKDRSQLREADRTWQQHKNTRGPLKDYGLKHKVEMIWDLNEDSIHDRMFVLKVDDYEVILDWEEVVMNGRWI